MTWLGSVGRSSISPISVPLAKVGASTRVSNDPLLSDTMTPDKAGRILGANVTMRDRGWRAAPTATVAGWSITPSGQAGGRNSAGPDQKFGTRFGRHINRGWSIIEPEVQITAAAQPERFTQ